jgi:glycosyltransferase involved in cell wall biosynthesis
MEKPLKVLMVSTSDSLGGAAKAAYRIHNVERKLGVDSHMLVKNKFLLDDSITSVSEFEPVNVFYRILSYAQNKVKNKVQHYRWSKYPNKEDLFMSDLRSTSIHDALQKFDYDILHLHWINLHFLDLYELNKIGKPIVWTLHDCWPFTGICHYFYNCDRYKNSCGRCPQLHSLKDNDLSNSIWKTKKSVFNILNLNIVSPSRWLANAAKQSSIFKKHPVTVIPNPVNTKLFSPGSKSDACNVLHLDDSKEYLLYCAMNALNDKNKGFKYIIDAMYLLYQHQDSNVPELLVVGADEPITQQILDIPVHYLGEIKEEKLMVIVYQAASLTLVPSLSENLSNVILESHACSTPVVAFNIGGNSDIIDHLQTGYLANEINSNELVKGIVWCLENNQENQISKNARKKAVDYFTNENVAIKYNQLYKSLACQ